jgi:hypothetical protein
MKPEGLLPHSQELPLVCILSQIEPVHTTSSYLSKIYFNIVHHLHLGLCSGLFPSGFPTNILCSPIRNKRWMIKS